MRGRYRGIQKTENGQNGDPKLCAKRELAVWTKLLGAVVAKVSKGGFEQVTVAARKAQQAWMASREQICRAFDNVDPGMALGGSDYCRILARPVASSRFASLELRWRSIEDLV